MEIHEQTVDGVSVVRLAGDLDSRTASAVSERLTGIVVPRGRLVVDLTGVPYMSSAGLRTMLLLYRSAQCVDATVALVGVSEELRSVMSATGFLSAFVVEASVPQALGALHRHGEV